MKMLETCTGGQHCFLSDPGGSSAEEEEEEEEERQVLLLWLQRSGVFYRSRRQAPLRVLGFLQQVEISKRYCALNENTFQNKAKLKNSGNSSHKKFKEGGWQKSTCRSCHSCNSYLSIPFLGKRWHTFC